VRQKRISKVTKGYPEIKTWTKTDYKKGRTHKKSGKDRKAQKVSEVQQNRKEITTQKLIEEEERKHHAREQCQ